MYKILVVDDVTLNLKNINSVLGEKYSLTLVKSGREALRSIVNEKPDLILLDVLMPEMDGFETFSRINSKFGDIPVIFLTAVDDREKVISILNKPNITGYILKPYNPAVLCERVDRFFLELERKNR